MKLRHLHAVDDEARVLAAENRDTWQDAVAAYCARRKRALEAEYATKASFDRSSLRLQAKCLTEILGLLTQGVMKIPDTPAVIERRADEDSADYLVRLGSLLTPAGWEAHVLPVLLERRATAMAAAFDDEDEERNVALITEIDYLHRVLNSVAQKAQEARGQRGMSPRAYKNKRHEAAM